jgi:hypothetical protein
VACAEDGGGREDHLEGGGREVDVSYTRGKLIRTAVGVRGVRVLIYGNVGCPPANGISERAKQQVLNLTWKVYGGFSDMHFTQMLADPEGVVLSREAVRRLSRGSSRGSTPLYMG